MWVIVRLESLTYNMSLINRYLRVLKIFARNSLIRSMMFRANFFWESFSNLSWVFLNLGYYLLVFRYTPSIGKGSGWTEFPYFVFMATVQFIYSLVEAFLMPNVEEFSELVRNGDLDFALLKPIDTQFLISLAKFDWSAHQFPIRGRTVELGFGSPGSCAAARCRVALSVLYRLRRGHFI